VRGRRPSLPAELRIYAIGDIHGRLDLLSELLARISSDIALRPTARPLYVFLGDYIDRGPSSREKIDRLNEHWKAHEFVFLKGIHELMDAIAIVLAETPTVRFVLAGGQRDCTAADMEAWLLPPCLHRHRAQIKFTGWLTSRQMDEYYRDADILVVPSWYEPFGMVVLEGMIHGLAVAASAVGGPAEILKDGETGLLFPPRDASALADAILRLTNDAPLRARIARAGAQDVREKWLWSRIVEKMRGVYQEMI